MTGISNEYYFMRNPEGAYASIVGYDPSPGEHINDGEVAEYRFSKYSQIKDKLRDYVYAEGNAVISKKVYDAIAPLNIAGIQLVPAIIKGAKKTFEGYYYIHFTRGYTALNRERSLYDWNELLELANPIKKIVLNDELLANIPLNERLAFYLAENSVFQLFHQSVADAILAVNPDGLALKKVSEYGKGVYWW